VGAAVGAIGHRVGFAGQFVMQSGGDEAPADRRRRRVGVNHVVDDATPVTMSGEGRVHGLDDVAPHAEVAHDRQALRPIIH
jgi:hypothetical protein